MSCALEQLGVVGLYVLHRVRHPYPLDRLLPW